MGDSKEGVCTVTVWYSNRVLGGTGQFWLVTHRKGEYGGEGIWFRSGKICGLLSQNIYLAEKTCSCPFCSKAYIFSSSSFMRRVLWRKACRLWSRRAQRCPLSSWMTWENQWLSVCTMTMTSSFQAEELSAEHTWHTQVPGPAPVTAQQIPFLSHFWLQRGLV